MEGACEMPKSNLVGHFTPETFLLPVVVEKRAQQGFKVKGRMIACKNAAVTRFKLCIHSKTAT